MRSRNENSNVVMNTSRRKYQLGSKHLVQKERERYVGRYKRNYPLRSHTLDTTDAA